MEEWMRTVVDQPGGSNRTNTNNNLSSENDDSRRIEPGTRTIEGNRRTHTERTLVPHSRDQVFAVVADVGSYSEFLPWCQRSEVIRMAPGGRPFMDAELEIGFGPLRERYCSRVWYTEPEHIGVAVLEGALMQHLSTHWWFAPGPGNDPQSTWLSFVVDFQFHSGMHTRVADMFFNQVAASMRTAFVDRCDYLYGRPSRDVLEGLKESLREGQ